MLFKEPIHINSQSQLISLLLSHISSRQIGSNAKILLIGGCSRSGKSELAKQLCFALEENYLSSTILSLDSWLISHNQRPFNSTVLQRYDVNSIVKTIREFCQGKPIFPPIYDASLRLRIKERSAQPIYNKSDIIIVEGVVALTLIDLFELSFLKIHVDIADDVRKHRLRDFYLKKGFSQQKADEIISCREFEEVPFIQSMQKFSDILYKTI